MVKSVSPAYFAYTLPKPATTRNQKNSLCDETKALTNEVMQ
jgi:hypothetical protein